MSGTSIERRLSVALLSSDASEGLTNWMTLGAYRGLIVNLSFYQGDVSANMHSADAYKSAPTFRMKNWRIQGKFPSFLSLNSLQGRSCSNQV